jgi:ADP-ribose pyrophosphatase YjhB (NUDIX family)
MLRDAVFDLRARDDVLHHEVTHDLAADHWPDPDAAAVHDDGREVAGTYAGVAVRDPDDRLLLVRHGDDDDREWAVPGGHVEPDETVREAAVREVEEETGVTSTVERPLSVAEQTFEHPSADRESVGFFVLYGGHAEDTTTGDDLGLEAAPEEILEARWFEELPAETYVREKLLADLAHWDDTERVGRAGR